MYMRRQASSSGVDTGRTSRGLSSGMVVAGSGKDVLFPDPSRTLCDSLAVADDAPQLLLMDCATNVP